VTLAGAIRLVLALHAPAFVNGYDSSDYVSAAFDLATRGEFTLRFKRAPLYPLFIASGISRPGPTLEQIALLQHGLGLLSVVLTYLLGAVAIGRGTGLLGALGVAVNGALLLMERSIMSEVLFTPLLLLGTLLFLLAIRQDRHWIFILAGATLGLAALTRPAAQAVLPLVLGLALLARSSWRWRLGASALILLGYLVVTGPWLARNYAEHATIAISGGLGDTLYARLRRHDRSFDFRDRGEPELDPTQARIRRRIFDLAREQNRGRPLQEDLRDEFGLTEAQSDRALRDADFQVIRQEPTRYVQSNLGMWLRLGLGIDKPLSQLWSTRIEGDRGQYWQTRHRFIIEQPFPNTTADFELTNALTRLYQDQMIRPLILPLIVLGGLRCLSGWRQGLPLLPLIVLSQLLLYAALDGPIARYRYPFQPMITLLAAAGLTLLSTAAWRRLAPLWHAGHRTSGEGNSPNGRPSPATR